MARIDLPEPYAIRFARQSVRDSLMSHGEECVLLSTYHVTTDFNIQPRCPECYDDLYQGPEKMDCATCYGTTFLGGVRTAYRTWAIFGDAVDQEDVTKHGFWHPIKRKLQTEHSPDIWEHDFVVRVPIWSPNHEVVAVEGIYVMDVVTNESMRTGHRFGQTVRDAVGQSADISLLSPQMPINRYPLIGKRFDRADGRFR